MSLPLEDYGLIGDTCTAALVGRNGSIDWLCAPRFDAAACFAALLGDSGHGRWLMAPASGSAATSRRYRHNSMVLETEFHSREGAAVVIDFMPSPPAEGRVDLVRMVRGLRGSMPMRMELIMRFDYGRIIPWVRRRKDGLYAIAGPDAMQFRCPVPIKNEHFTTTAQFSIAAGETASFTLTWHPSHHAEPPAQDPESLLKKTDAWWRRWCDRYTLDNPWSEAIMRSLLTLKALTYSPTGGIVASPTTSLPEKLGGVRNWDYRYCWLRDATFTLYAFLIAGYKEEAQAWREWLLRAVAGQPEKLQIMYGVAGERRLDEVKLDWLPGYAQSGPVRTGNNACRQFQIDTYGELMDVLHAARKHDIEYSDEAWHVQRELLDFLETAWREPDEGIWEVRGGTRQFTHSKVMAWVAFDRAVKAVERFELQGPAERWRKICGEIRDDVCRRGFDPDLNAFVQYYGGKKLDAALLMIPWVGFLPAHDTRVVGTVEAIRRELSVDGFVSRYATETQVDGLPPGEGVFLPCSFWLADNLVMMGRHDEAREIFEKLLSIRNDLGLLAEEYDPQGRRHLGNFPQAFSHVALIHTAHNLERGEEAAKHRAGNSESSDP